MSEERILRILILSIPFMYLGYLINKLMNNEVKMINKIDPFDLVVPCKPDCTPKEHAYHQGTWDAHIKLEEIIKSIKEE